MNNRGPDTHIVWADKIEENGPWKMGVPPDAYLSPDVQADMDEAVATLIGNQGRI